MPLRPFLPLAALLVWVTTPALAGLEVCNETNTSHQIAIGYSSDGVWTSEGWWTVPANDCITVIGEDLKARYYYWRAQAEGHDYGGEYAFCVTASPFTIEGDTDCEARGYREEMFDVSDSGPTATQWTIALTGAPVVEGKTGQSQPPAATAPVQPAAQSSTKTTIKTPVPNTTVAPAPSGPAPRPGFPAPVFYYSDFDSGMPSGQLGEPFSVTARFLECVAPEGDLYCLFTAEGWNWYAYATGGTPSFAFDAMLGLTPGQTVYLQGDLISYGDISTEMVVRSFVAEERVSTLDTLWAAMQGSFGSATDSAYSLSVTSNNFLEIYDGNISNDAIFRLADSCEGSNGAGPVILVTELETQEAQCLFVVDWGADGFTTTPAGGWQETIWIRW